MLTHFQSKGPIFLGIQVSCKEQTVFDQIGKTFQNGLAIPKALNGVMGAKAHCLGTSTLRFVRSM